MEPSSFVYDERHDNIEAIYKKLMEQRDTADVTALMEELHRIVNEAIRTQELPHRPRSHPHGRIRSRGFPTPTPGGQECPPSSGAAAFSRR